MSSSVLSTPRTTSPDGNLDAAHLLKSDLRLATLRDAGRIAEEVIAHLVGQVAADVAVRLEIAADLPKGVSDQVVRTVIDNSRTEVDAHGFEKD